MKHLLIAAAAGLALGLAGVTAYGAQAGMFTVRPTATCDDGLSIAVSSANGACADDGGVYSYQHVAFICSDGTLIEDPSTPNPCASNGGVSQQLPQPAAEIEPQPSNVPAEPIPVFPTNR